MTLLYPLATSDFAIWFVVGLLSVLLGSYLFSPVAAFIGLVDHSAGRKRHEGAIPLIGGTLFFTVLALFSFVVVMPQKLGLISGFLLIIFFLGLADDRFRLGSSLRLIVQLIVTTFALLFAEVELDKIGPIFNFDPNLGWAALPISVIFIVGFVNAFNMIDGIDGLAIGQAIISFVLLYWVQSQDSAVPFAEWYFLTLGVLVALFAINTSMISLPKLFLGDSGSTVIGFLLAWLVIDLSQSVGQRIHPVAGLWCIAFPIFDFCATLLRRIRLRASVFEGDRSHLHHLLVDSGISQTKALIFILMLSLLMSLSGVFLTITAGVELGIMYFCVALCLFLVISSNLDKVLRARCHLRR